MRKFIIVSMVCAFILIGIASTVSAADVPSNTNADANALLNQYLQSQQQSAQSTQTGQSTALGQQANTANANSAQNQKLVWPWWTKVFAASIVVNSVVVFFALTFSLAALWKWLALKR